MLRVLDVAAEVFPIIYFQLTQLIIHEDQDSESAKELFGLDMNKLPLSLGLVEPDHGEVSEDVHDGHALARLIARRKERMR